MIIQRQNHDRAPATIAHSELDAALSPQRAHGTSAGVYSRAGGVEQGHGDAES